MKTNKSFTKRLRVTKKGKILARKAGVNHFNSKERRTKQLSKRKNVTFKITNKARSLFILP